MRLPTEMPGVGRLVYQPVFAFESLNDSISPQGPFDFIPGIGGGLRRRNARPAVPAKPDL
jgi:hypothetical protein